MTLLSAMTLLYIHIGTAGVWWGLPAVQFGLQWRHSNHDAPYLHLTFWRWRLIASWNLVYVQSAVKGVWPQLWETRKRWQRREGVKDSFTRA